MNITIQGKVIDNETRCVHYHSKLDIVAIRFRCCKTYYPCFYCHEETAGHVAETWSRDEFDALAIICGVCKSEMAINQYKSSGHQCPQCGAGFNPKCKNHDHLYFET